MQRENDWGRPDSRSSRYIVPAISVTPERARRSVQRPIDPTVTFVPNESTGGNKWLYYLSIDMSGKVGAQQHSQVMPRGNMESATGFTAMTASVEEM